MIQRLSQQSSGSSHAFRDGHVKGAIVLARMACHALACLRAQSIIVALDGFGHAFMQNSQVVIFIHGCNIDAHHAWLAVTAVNAVASVGMLGRRAQNTRVIQVLAQCGVVAQSILQVGITEATAGRSSA